jgi:hypothetical protein
MNERATSFSVIIHPAAIDAPRIVPRYFPI